MLKKLLFLLLAFLLASCTYFVPAAGKSATNQKKNFPRSVPDTTSVQPDKLQKDITVKNIKDSQTPIKSATIKSGLKQSVTHSDGNIRGLAISAKSNGTMIKIETSEEFGEKDVAVSISADNFLNITIYRGILDKAFPEKITTYGSLTDISYFAFAASTQLTVKLKKKVASKSVIIKPDKIIISLFENE